jgi:MinD superfamily P-loop ATPase
MAKVVTFFSAKGGQGKTTLAINYALYSNSKLFTNDYKSGSEIYRKLFNENMFELIKDDTESVIFEDDEKIVFDLGGYIDKKVPAIIKGSDLCIIPVMYQSKIDLEALFIVFESITALNKNIYVVINNTENSLSLKLQEIITKKIQTKTYIVNRSSYMTYLANENKTPFQIDLVGLGVVKKPLISLQKQLINLFDEIKEY